MKSVKDDLQSRLKELSKQLTASLSLEQKRLILSMVLEYEVEFDGNEFVLEGSKRLSIAELDKRFPEYLEKALPPQGLENLSVVIEDNLEAESGNQ